MCENTVILNFNSARTARKIVAISNFQDKRKKKRSKKVRCSVFCNWFKRKILVDAMEILDRRRDKPGFLTSTKILTPYRKTGLGRTPKSIGLIPCPKIISNLSSVNEVFYKIANENKISYALDSQLKMKAADLLRKNGISNHFVKPIAIIFTKLKYNAFRSRDYAEPWVCGIHYMQNIAGRQISDDEDFTDALIFGLIYGLKVANYHLNYLKGDLKFRNVIIHNADKPIVYKVEKNYYLFSSGIMPVFVDAEDDSFCRTKDDFDKRRNSFYIRPGFLPDCRKDYSRAECSFKALNEKRFIDFCRHYTRIYGIEETEALFLVENKDAILMDAKLDKEIFSFEDMEKFRY